MSKIIVEDSSQSEKTYEYTPNVFMSQQPEDIIEMTTRPQPKNNLEDISVKGVYDIIFLLDESGSMDIMGNEPLQALNQFIKDQKLSLDDGSRFSLWKFNTRVSKLIDDVLLSKINTEVKDFKPFGMTSLYDALGHAITRKKQKSKSINVICVILTDGLDNSSKEFNKENIEKMIKEMETKYNWKFIYLGTNQDVFTASNEIGITNYKEYDCSQGGLLSLSKEISQDISEYRISCSQLV